MGRPIITEIPKVCVCSGKKRWPCGHPKCKKSFASHPRSKYLCKDNKYRADQMSRNCTELCKFKCNVCPHTFEKTPHKISSDNGWCPYCAGQKLCEDPDCKDCFEKSFASDERAQYWSEKNGMIQPRDVFRRTAHKYYLDCYMCPHTFHMQLSVVTEGSWCPYCSKPPKLLCDNPECKPCFEKSFASHSLSKRWSKKNKRKARQVFLNANTKYWIDCDKCPHAYKITPGNANNDRSCPYCSDKTSSIMCKDTNCDYCFQRSFASHEKSSEWSDQNKDTPRDIKKNSCFKRKFDCKCCKHEYERVVSKNATTKNMCQYCSGDMICDNKDCKHCFKNSFAASSRAKDWSPDNDVEPWQVKINSATDRKFKCPYCTRTFELSPSNIKAGQWCRSCKNKTERKLLDFLEANCAEIVEHDKKFKWCMRKQMLPFDFCYDDIKVIIELDGVQHFQAVKYFYKDDPAQALKNDIFKMRAAIEQGYTFIRLSQEDVYQDKNQWKSRLLKHIREHNTQKVILLDNSKNLYAPMYKALKRIYDEDDSIQIHRLGCKKRP